MPSPPLAAPPAGPLAELCAAPVVIVEPDGRIIDRAGPHEPALPDRLPSSWLNGLIGAGAPTRWEIEGRVWSVTVVPWPGADQLLALAIRPAPEALDDPLPPTGPAGSGIERSLDVATALRQAREAEDEALRHAQRLAAANRELELYASLVAHDLRAPVRSARILTERTLHAALARRDDDLATELGGHLDRALTRIDDLICRLIDYGSVLDHEPRPRHLDGAEFLASCLDAAATTLQDDGDLVRHSVAIVASDDLEGDPSLLVPVVAELVVNAVKYRDTERPLAVGLAAQRTAAATIVTVADNGLGIPDGHADRAFDLFSRLHSGLDVDGLGFGLAYCRRALDHHGGSIALSAGPGDTGTTMTVTLPWRT